MSNKRTHKTGLAQFTAKAQEAITEGIVKPDGMDAGLFGLALTIAEQGCEAYQLQDGDINLCAQPVTNGEVGIPLTCNFYNTLAQRDRRIAALRTELTVERTDIDKLVVVGPDNLDGPSVIIYVEEQVGAWLARLPVTTDLGGKHTFGKPVFRTATALDGWCHVLYQVYDPTAAAVAA